MRKIISLNNGWQFYKGVDFAGERQQAEQINIPHSWNAIDGQDGGNDYFRGTCLYEKSISAGQLKQGARCYLEINGANSSATVYFNGEKWTISTLGEYQFRRTYLGLKASLAKGVSG